jgi:hypothetical protein
VWAAADDGPRACATGATRATAASSTTTGRLALVWSIEAVT